MPINVNKIAGFLKASMEKKVSDNFELACEESMDISIVSEMHAKILDEVRDGVSVSINASNVERVDAAALQMFASLFKSAESLNVSVNWIEPSDTLKNSAGLLGLSGVLHLD